MKLVFRVSKIVILTKSITHDEPSVLCPDSEPHHTDFGRTLYRQFCQLLHGERITAILSN